MALIENKRFFTREELGALGLPYAPAHGVKVVRFALLSSTDRFTSYELIF